MRGLTLILAVVAALSLPSLAMAATAPDPPAKTETWATYWHAKAKAQRAKAAKLMKALQRKPPRPLPARADYTSTDASGTVTLDEAAWGAACKARALHLREYVVPKLHRLVFHPGGGRYGAKRWMPLARYVGWPDHALPMLRKVIWRESNGDPSQVTPPYGATGLMQWIRPWWSGQWALPAFNPYDPATNLRMGLRLWRMQGGSFLPAWRLTAW